MERTRVTVDLTDGCTDPGCVALAQRLHEELSTGAYTWPCSILPLTTLDQWDAAHGTARKRAARCERDGYRFQEIRREEHSDAIYAINTSVPERQGRPMSPGYREHHVFGPLPEYPCYRHRIHTYGVLDRHETLRAYTWVYRSGQLVMLSQILGHHDHLTSHVMYLLVRGVIAEQAARGGAVFYNRHDSGTDGLRFFKERCGFKPARVDWRP